MNVHDPSRKSGVENQGDMSLLDQVLGATRDEARAETPEILKSLIGDALKGTPARSKDVTTAIQEAIETVERDISDQLAQVLHDPGFQALEASWRGLFELVRRGETDSMLKIKVLNVSKVELMNDLGSDAGPESSRLHQRLVAPRVEEGEEPFAVLIDDHDLTVDPEDVALLGSLAAVATSAGCLVLASGSSTICGLPRWSDLDEEFALGTGLTAEQASAWREFGKSEGAQSVVLTMPRVLARRPYGAETAVVEEFAFEELGREPESRRRFTWMNPSFIVGALVNDAFAQGGRPGVNELFETGGRIGNLICIMSRDEDGDPVVDGPVEVFLDRHRDAELREMGFSPLQYIRNSESVVLNGFRTPYQPDPE
jgi:type VI secretion system protein ImpC